MCKSEGVCGCGEECAAFGEECDSKVCSSLKSSSNKVIIIHNGKSILILQ